MKTITKLFCVCAGIMELAAGCSEIEAEMKSRELEWLIESQKYCTEEIDLYGTIQQSIGDFNEDGHLDYILSGRCRSDIYSPIRSCLLEGDGKGNFTLKKYPIKELDITQLEGN